MYWPIHAITSQNTPGTTVIGHGGCPKTNPWKVESNLFGLKPLSKHQRWSHFHPPGTTEVTPSPTDSTIPAASWPRIQGKRPAWGNGAWENGTGIAEGLLLYWIIPVLNG